jgi:hypothetical protein
MDLRAVAEIDEIKLSCVINYFAWESSSNTDQAKSVSLAMAAIGLRAYFQKELGWQPQRPMTYLESLKQLVEIEEHKERVKSGYPGLNSTYDSAGAEKRLMETGLSTKFTLKDWIAVKQLKLDRKDRTSLGNFLASTVERDTSVRLYRERGGRVWYTHEHLPLLDEGLKAWQERGGTIKTA